MARNEEAPAAVVQMTFEQVQALMAGTMTQAMEAFVEAQRRPSASDIARRNQAKKEWRAVEDDNKRVKAEAQAACQHRNRQGHSTFWYFENVFPRGAKTLICCRCRKMICNYELTDANGKDVNHLINNPEFTRWINEPRIAADVG